MFPLLHFSALLAIIVSVLPSACGCYAPDGSSSPTTGFLSVPVVAVAPTALDILVPGPPSSPSELGAQTPAFLSQPSPFGTGSGEVILGNGISNNGISNDLLSIPPPDITKAWLAKTEGSSVTCTCPTPETIGLGIKDRTSGCCGA